MVQHGDMSSLSYTLESGYIGEIIFVWIFVILVICGIAYSTLQEDDDAPPAATKKKGNNKNGKKSSKKKHK